MRGLSSMAAAVFFSGWMGVPPAVAIEPNATDRMREISEIIVCRGHVPVAAMGVQGQPEAKGDPSACPRSAARGDDPRPALDGLLSIRSLMPDPPLTPTPPITPGGGGPPPIIAAPPAIVSPPSSGGGYYLVK